MKMKFFVSGISEPDAVRKTRGSLSEIIDEKYFRVVESEKYWKIEDVYIVLIEISDMNSDIEKLLNHYSDSWLSFGDPVKEFLASDHNKECHFMRGDFIMIQLFL